MTVRIAYALAGASTCQAVNFLVTGGTVSAMATLCLLAMMLTVVLGART